MAGDFEVAVDRGGGPVHLIAWPISDLVTLCGVAASNLEPRQAHDLGACQSCWTPAVPMQVWKELSAKHLRDPDESLI